METQTTDIIPVEPAGTLADLFRERLERSAQARAYIQYNESTCDWESFSWQDTADEVSRWQVALQNEGLKPGDRVALAMKNCREWAIFDQAALGLGLVTVPLYPNDRPENIGYILVDSGARLLFIDGQVQWQKLQEVRNQLTGLVHIVTLEPVATDDPHSLCVHKDDWLPESPTQLLTRELQPDDLATIVYTSGTTGRSKGVMLSHRNILWNAWASLQVTDVFPADLFLSFLPLCHMLERTAGYYLPMMAGASVAYARSIPQLAEDLETVKPTILISVPRIFERVYGKIHAKLDTDSKIARAIFNKAVDTGWKRFQHQQGRGPWSPALLLWPILNHLVAQKIKTKLGGRLRVAVCGGAALSPDVARLFISLDVPIIQGYGLTETSPVISANSLSENIPASVGMPLGGMEIKIGENDELLTRSQSVMLGYWNNQEATERTIDKDGWLHTGDKVRMEGKHLFITGRLKEIIVLANGENIPPADLEMAIATDGLFDQVMIVGEGKPFLAALVVVNEETYPQWAESVTGGTPTEKLRDDPQLKKALIDRIGSLLHGFPGYTRVLNISVADEPWTIENGLMTPTLKLRRDRILEHYAPAIGTLYEGH